MGNKKLPEWINKEQFTKLLEEAKRQREQCWKPRLKKFTKRGERLNAYITAMILGFGGGLRISEVCGLVKEQTYTYKKKGEEEPTTKTIKTVIPRLTYDKIQDKFIKIYGKGQKERTTYFPSRIFQSAKITREDLKKILPIGNYDGHYYRSLQYWFSNLTNKVLGKKLHFHCLRHSFCSILAGSGKPLHEVQALSGHSRLDTLGIYTHANPEQTIKGLDDLF